ncbi:MAG: HI0074 family nucleotidyltransferase substrate-binding subunit [Pseudomonadota bacterium]
MSNARNILLEKYKNKRNTFNEALTQLVAYALEKPKRPIEIAGLIQGFEFTFEAAWKVLNVASLLKGVDCAGPRDSLKAAYSLRLIENQALWLEMLEDRNQTTHRYDAGFVNRLSGTIQKDYLPIFQKLLSTLNNFDGDSHLSTP